MWLLREKVYSLSSELGKLGSAQQLEELQTLLHAWGHEGVASRKDSIARHIESKYMRDAVLVITDMSGFTRITREEGILHFMMLIKEMQAICVPIFERYGGRLVKVEADDLFVIFPASGPRSPTRSS